MPCTGPKDGNVIEVIPVVVAGNGYIAGLPPMHSCELTAAAQMKVPVAVRWTEHRDVFAVIAVIVTVHQQVCVEAESFAGERVGCAQELVPDPSAKYREIRFAVS